MAILHDADSKIATPATASPATWSHTCTGSNRVLVVMIEVKTTASPVSAVTYNSVSMTKITGASIADATNAISYEMWYLLNPAVGAHTISVTWTTGAARRLLGVAVSLTGVLALDANSTASGTVSGTTPQPSVAVTTVANNSWVIGGTGVNDNTALAAGSSQTLINQINDGTTPFHTLAGSYRGPQTPAGSAIINFTGTVNTDSWVIGAASFSPITGIYRLDGQDAQGLGTTSATATYASTPTQNNLLVAVIRDDNGSITLTGWTQAVTSGSQFTGTIMYKVAGAGESTTVTATDSGASEMEMYIYEYSGLATSSPLDKTATGAGNGTTSTPSGTTPTTTVTTELCIAYMVMRGTTTVSAVSNSFNIRNQAPGLHVVADRIVSSTGAYSTNFTSSANTSSLDGTGIATFKGLVAVVITPIYITYRPAWRS